MTKPVHTIGVVAPSRRLDQSVPKLIHDLAEKRDGETELNIKFHDQCFKEHGHFAGSDKDRSRALIEFANDPSIDTIWFARGGYGAARVGCDAIAAMDDVARRKTFVGYSDTGFLLARLHKERIGRCVHGPMPTDVLRAGGDAAINRILQFVETEVVEGDVIHDPLYSLRDAPHIALNLTVLVHMLGTDWLPQLDGYVLIVEDIDEHLYCLDRAMFSVVNSSAVKRLAGIVLGRFSDVPPNDVEFGRSAEQIVQHWCHIGGIPYKGRANIGHDADNSIVVFGAPLRR